MRTQLVVRLRRAEGQEPSRIFYVTGAELDERWTKLMGRKVWRNINTGETWVEEK